MTGNTKNNITRMNIIMKMDNIMIIMANQSIMIQQLNNITMIKQINNIITTNKTKITNMIKQINNITIKIRITIKLLQIIITINLL